MNVESLLAGLRGREGVRISYVVLVNDSEYEVEGTLVDYDSTMLVFDYTKEEDRKKERKKKKATRRTRIPLDAIQITAVEFDL